MDMNATAQSAFDLAVSTSAPRRPLRVALLGFGTVGQSVARILAERPELRDRLQLTHVYNRSVSRKRVDWVDGDVNWSEDLAEIFASAPDIVVEVMGGVEPAFTVVKQAMEQGASIVTANKMLLAAHGRELLKLASDRGVQLRFEASVAGGVPLIHGVREGLAGDQLTGVAGILNGTCNYILSRMAATNEDITPVLADAQRLGYAEADPTADVDGHDAAAKLVVLAGIAFKRFVNSDAIPKGSIRAVSSADFCYARRLDATIRQISEIQARDDGFYAFVGPASFRTIPALAGTRERTTSSAFMDAMAAKVPSVAPAPAGRPLRLPSYRTFWP